MVTQKDADQLLEKLIPILRLQNWEIELTIQTDRQYQKQHGKDFAFDTHGCTEMHEQADIAHIYLKDSLTDEEMRETLLHECVHLMTHRYDTHVRKVVSLLDSKKLQRTLGDEGMWEMEINVSRITTILKCLGVI